MKNLKQIIAENPKVDQELFRESMRMSKRFAKARVGERKRYNLPSPFDTRLVKTSVLELTLLSEKAEK